MDYNFKNNVTCTVRKYYVKKSFNSLIPPSRSAQKLLKKNSKPSRLLIETILQKTVFSKNQRPKTKGHAFEEVNT